MSVENCYLAVDWSELQRLSADADLFETLTACFDEEEDDEGADESNEDEASEDEEAGESHGFEGSRMLEFGSQMQMHYFESVRMVMEFTEWFQVARAGMNPFVAKAFAALFTDVGLLFDEHYATTAPRQGVAFSDEWLVATISPTTVADLRRKAVALDRGALEQEFGKALGAKPCTGLPNGASVVDWVDALQAGLSELEERGEGLVIGVA